MTSYQEDPVWRRGATAAEIAKVAEIDSEMASMDQMRSELSKLRHSITMRAVKRARRAERKGK